jgi:lysosomal Pro-X carboxypeptidase
VWELAQQIGALVVFAEHRYYGDSMPYGNQSSSKEHLNYLTSEQALADYAYLIKYIKLNYNGAEKSPVIAFGGKVKKTQSKLLIFALLST